MKWIEEITFSVFVSIFLTACNSSALSISEIEIVPNKVQGVIDDNNTLQIINEGKNISYIVFRSKGIVTTDLETQGDTLIIKLDVTNQHDNAVKQHVYKLTLDPNLDTIDIRINGKSTVIDSVTGI
ncbi:peptidylprolyl isomerase [Lysinibacillus parviboronicapiens]|uniref:peptidylprolyl isomerase n=1 Tax=Lysinibacillus parviboronicapiens TaxID=436516 RepID=UPI000D374EC2|nr:peptidylprolyl isomerase [Lysinibacillus parviboronicapiens]